MNGFRPDDFGKVFQGNVRKISKEIINSGKNHQTAAIPECPACRIFVAGLLVQHGISGNHQKYRYGGFAEKEICQGAEPS